MVKKTFKIGKVIAARLANIKGVTVGNMVLPEDTPLPVIVYQKTSHVITYDKECSHSDVIFVIVTIAKNYAESIRLSSEVNEQMQDVVATFDGLTCGYSRIKSIAEEVEDGCYIIRMDYNLRFTE